MVYLILWIALMFIFVVVEMMTLSFVTTWFAIGSIAALIAAACGADLTIQITIFLLVSILVLLIMRPIMMRHQNRGEAMNADKIIGTKGIITEPINEINGKGQVKIGGQIWTCKSEDGETIKNGKQIIVQSIEGVTAVVKKDNNS